MMAVYNLLSWVALVSGFQKLVVSLYSSLLSSFVYVIHIQAENEHLNSQVPLLLLLSETVGRFLSSLSDIRFWTGWKMLAVAARTAHHILSAGAPLVAPDERWYHTGPLSSGVNVLIDLVTDQPPACCSLFCLLAVLVWCNWQTAYWFGNYCNAWDGWGRGGVGPGNPRVRAASWQHENDSVSTGHRSSF